jgi:hypothetical protein
MSAPLREDEEEKDKAKRTTESVQPEKTQTISQPPSEAKPTITLQHAEPSSAPPSTQPATPSAPSSIQATIQHQKEANASDELKERDKTRINYWEKLDALFYGTIKHAETAFTINITLNIIVAAVGLAILSYSIAYSWINGLDLYTTAFGSLGVVSFIALFYFAPQKKIQKTMGDLAQLQMLYRTYFMQAEEVNDLCYRHNPTKIEELVKINNHLKDMTCEICQKIEEYVGEKGD